MLIYVAENGQSTELACQPMTSVEIVQNCLVSSSGIPIHDQMLICGDTRLEPHKTLGSYKLPAEARHVFLFNRARLVSDCPPPAPEEAEAISIVMPPDPPRGHGGHPLDEAIDPALKALPTYERLFKFHFQKGHAIFSASQRRFEASRRLLREQKVQDMALETARGNMDFYYKIIDHAFNEFLRHFTRQHKQHSDLLAHFQRDLDRLRSCKLHPSLRSDARRTLLDCVKEASLRKWAEDCAFSHKQFGGKVAELKTLYVELQRSVQTLFYTPSAVDVRDLEDTIEDHVRFTEEQASIIQSLSKDVNTVKKLVDDCVSTQFSASLRPHDAVSALEPMYEVHDKNHLPRMEACDGELGKLLDYCKTSKNAMNVCVHTRLQSVAALQSNIRDMRNQLAVFKEAMTRQDDIFAELKLVRRVGSAYKACLAEVVRRKACMKLYMGQAGQLAEKLARKREAEVARREEFLRVQSVYIPRDILEAMGLFEVPSQCVVNIAPFDMNLLDIDITDVERYAPESSVGPLFKGSGSDQSGRGSSRLHSDSGFRSAGGSDSILESRDGQDIDTNEENSGGDEIAGTSKLEVENAWLKSELASAVAMLCNLDPDFELEEGAGDSQDQDEGGDCERGRGPRQIAAQKTAEALRLKDEHAKCLHKMLAMRQAQCGSYEKRIRELEQRLSEQHMQLQKLASAGDRRHTHSHVQVQGGRASERIDQEFESSEISGLTAVGTGRMHGVAGVPEPMDEGVSSAAAFEVRHASSTTSIDGQADSISGQRGGTREGGDETMSDVSGVVSTSDAGMGELRKDEAAGSRAGDEGEPEMVNTTCSSEEQGVEERGTGVVTEVTAARPPSTDSDKTADEVEVLLRGREEALTLQTALVEKNGLLAASDDRLNAALAEVVRLRTELEGNADLLSECQMNCAHLENRLHEAREEARTNLCAADRRAAEYNALRTSSVRLRGLVERLRSCIAAPSGNPASFADSLRALAVSLSSVSVNDAGEDIDFRSAIRVLAERVGTLAQQRAELLDRCTIAEGNQSHLKKELDNQTELLRSLYSKRKSDKQASKEKICFTRFDVHGLAVFLPNGSGHYEAMNHNCPHYYLSGESIALFREQGLPSGTPYIVGQIVHIDRKIAIPAPPPAPHNTLDGNLNGSEQAGGDTTATVPTSSRARHNPYGLPVGTEYFLVTVAMVPDLFPPSLSF